MIFDNRGLIVPDVSFYQDDDSTSVGIDFAKMRAAGAVGVIIRAGQNSWLDEDFKTNWRAAKEAGLPRGSYWFYDSRTDPAKQANQWSAAIGDDLPELDLWADLEENYNGPYKTERDYKNFVLATQAYFPTVEVGIYTADWWWYDKTKQGIIRDDAFWGALRLWVAQYLVDQSLVIVPRPWVNKPPVFWQFTASGDGARFGVESKEIDLNYFNGDADKFKSYFSLTSSLPPSGGETENAMQIIKGDVLANLVIRSAPAGTPTGDYLLTGNTIEADRNQYQWLHLTKVNGEAVSEESWASAGTQQQYIKWAWVEVSAEPQPEPDPDPEPEPVAPDYIVAGWLATATRPAIEKRYVPE